MLVWCKLLAVVQTTTRVCSSPASNLLPLLGQFVKPCSNCNCVVMCTNCDCVQLSCSVVVTSHCILCPVQRYKMSGLLIGWLQNVWLPTVSHRHQMSGRLQWRCGKCLLAARCRGLACLPMMWAYFTLCHVCPTYRVQVQFDNLQSAHYKNEVWKAVKLLCKVKCLQLFSECRIGFVLVNVSAKSVSGTRVWDGSLKTVCSLSWSRSTSWSWEL